MSRLPAWDPQPSRIPERAKSPASRLAAPLEPASSIEDVLATPGRPLDLATRGSMEARLGHDFSSVRVHTDEQAGASAAAIHADAYTVGRHVVFGAGRFAPHTGDGTRLLAHELTHVAQEPAVSAHTPGALTIDHPASAQEQTAAAVADHVAAGRPVGTIRPAGLAGLVHRQPTSLGAIPATERAALRISTVEVTVPATEIAAVFATTGTRTTYNSGGQVAFDPGIPATLQRGLQSVGGYLTNQTNALPLNSTVNVALDLTAYGGANSIYRFTWFSHTERTPGARTSTTGNVMLIELVGPATATAAPTTVPTGAFTAGGQSFNLRGTWSNAEFGQLTHALGLLPPAALTEATGLNFRRRSGQGPGTEAGHYDPPTDTVELYDNAFPSVSLRLGTVSRGEHNILHEIGHAIDLRVLERAWNTFNTGGQTAAGRRTFLGTRSPSGSRYVASGADFNQDLNIAAATDGAFRQAVRTDGVRRDTTGRTLSTGNQANLSGGVTEYSDSDYQEMFAEAYALYMENPDTLRLLRPATFAYFSSRYPRQP